MSTLATKNVAAALAAIALAFGITFAFAQTAKADTASDLQAQVQALLAQIAALQGGTSSSASTGFTFTRNHKVGDSGGEVMQIQKFLNSHGAVIATAGAGSPGKESSHFGAKTKAAVVVFQKANGVSPASGYWGALTRAKANAMNAAVGGTTTGTTGGTTPAPTGGTTGTTGGTTPAPTGPGLAIAAGTQPANSLAPASAVRVPFTTFTLTNNSGAAVTVTGVTVTRTGLAQDNNFSSIVLVDSQGLQLGNTQTLDSNHMATVGGTFTLAAGASQTFTVAGNIAASATAHSGEVASLTVTGVTTSVPVSGSLPITGASQTINTTLTLGSVTTAISTFDPNTTTNKNIGSTGIKFTGIRFTAGSSEDLKLYSIRWRINGSASLSDLSNIVTVVGGTSYPVVASADGRYFTTTFPGGVLVQKGFSIDAYIQGDLTGSNSAGRVVEFDVDKTSDVYFVGQLYGYGIAMAAGSGTVSTASTHATTYTSGQPVFQGSTVSIQAGTVTTIQNATSVAAQNIAVNIPNTVLGGFVTNFAGEPVTVSGLKLYITSTGTTSTSEITNISIVDQNGAVIAGPIDASASIANFTTSITFPVGTKTYTVKGKIPATGWPNNSTVQLNTTPSGWTSPTGQTTGNTITISTGLFTMNTMTIKAGTLAITAASSPASQNVVAGAQNLLMANIQFDASQSGEDVRMSSIPLNETGAAATANLSGCQLWDGTTALNTGSNVVNTINKGSGTANKTTFTFDNTVNFPKGTVKTLGLTCNLSSAATSSTYIWGVDSANTFTGTGKDSANTITPTATTGTSGTMTVSSGASVTVSIDASSPSYAVVAGGTTGVSVGVIKIRSANEDYNLQKLGLTLTSSGNTLSTGAGGSTNSGVGDLVTVYLYKGSTLLGTATFTGTNTTATSTFNAALTVPRDTDVQITVKADLAGISVSAPGGIGDIVKVDPLNVEGVGVQSGTNVKANATAGVAGVRLFKSYPVLALDTLSSTGVADGKLMHFKITANAGGPVGLGQMKFTLATTTLSVTNIQLFAFTDSSYSTPVSGQGSGGQIGATQSSVSSSAFAMAPSATPLQVPAGGTYYFELRGSVSGSASGASVVTTLKGDAAYTTGLTTGYNVATSAGATSTSGDNFTWSGLSTTTPSNTAGFINEVDWSNGYGISGLPSGGMIQTRGN